MQDRKPIAPETAGEKGHTRLSYTQTHTLTSHQREEKDHDEGVTKVEGVGECPSDGRLVDKVVDGEEEEVEASGGRGEEGAPPPAVVLRAEVEVAEEDGGLGTDHQQHQEGQHDETKHVVHLTIPEHTRCYYHYVMYVGDSGLVRDQDFTQREKFT